MRPRRFLRAFAAPFLLAFPLAACPGDEAVDPADGAETFTTNATSYWPYEIAYLSDVDASSLADGETVAGDMGGVDVVLARYDAQTMALVVPEEAVGRTVDLTFTVDGTTYEGTLTVLAVETLEDPEAYLQYAAASMAGVLQAVRDSVLADMDSASAAEIAGVLAEAEDSLASFEARMASLTPEEAEIAANVIWANFGFMLDAASGTSSGMAVPPVPAVCRSEPTALAMYKCGWGVFVDDVQDVAFTAVLVTGAVYTMQGPLVIPGLAVAAFGAALGAAEVVAATTSGIYLVKAHLMIAWEIGVTAFDAATTPFFRTTTTQSGSALAFAPALGAAGLQPSSMTEFVSERPTEFTFEARYRNVQSADAGLGISWLTTGLQALSQFNTLLSTFFAGDHSLTFEPVTQGWLPVTGEGQLSVVEHDAQVSVQDFHATADGYSVTFVTTATSAHTFTYDLVYANGDYPDVTVRHTATIQPLVYTLAIEDGAIVTTDTIEFQNGAPRTFELVYPDGSPISGLDYSKITLSSVNAGGLTLTTAAVGAVGDAFSVTATGVQYQTVRGSFDVNYDGRRVGTVRARVLMNLPLLYEESRDSLFHVQSLIGNHPDGCQYYHDLRGTSARVQYGTLDPATGRRTVTVTVNGVTSYGPTTPECPGATGAGFSLTVTGTADEFMSFEFTTEQRFLGWTMLIATGFVGNNAQGTGYEADVLIDLYSGYGGQRPQFDFRVSAAN